MRETLRTAHLAVGVLAVVAFLITGLLMNAHDPPVIKMAWDQRLLFSSRHIYLMFAGLVNVAMGIHYVLPESRAMRGVAVAGSLLVLGSAVMLFFAFFSEAMAGRWPGKTSGLALFAIFGGVLMYALAGFRRARTQAS
jgi:hypothetical protein